MKFFFVSDFYKSSFHDTFPSNLYLIEVFLFTHQTIIHHIPSCIFSLVLCSSFLRQPEIELLTFQVGMLYCDGDRVS